MSEVLEAFVTEEVFVVCGVACLGRGYSRLPTCAAADQERGGAGQGQRDQTDNESGREEEAFSAC